MEAEKPDDVTPPPDDANGGTPEDEAARNAAANDNQGKLIQTLQDKAARVNKAEAEAQTLRAERDALLRAQSPAAGTADPEAERRATVKRLAEGTMNPEWGPDAVAQQLLATEQKLDMALNEIMNMRELDTISDAGKRKQVLDHFNNNRHRLADIRGAKAEIESEQLAEQVKAQAEENDKLRKALEATSKRQNPDAISTHRQEVSAPALKAREMTQAEWEDEQAQLSVYDRMQRQKDLVNGRIALKR